MAGVLADVCQHMDMICSGIIVALSVHPVDQSVRGSIKNLIYNGEVLWVLQVAPLVLVGVRFTEPFWALCIVFHPMVVTDVEGQFDTP